MFMTFPAKCGQRDLPGIRYGKPPRQLRPSRWFAGLDYLHANASLAKCGEKPIDIVSFPGNARLFSRSCGQAKGRDEYLNFIDTVGRPEERDHMLKSIRDFYIYFGSDQFFRGHPDAAGHGYVVAHDSWCNVFAEGV